MSLRSTEEFGFPYKASEFDAGGKRFASRFPPVVQVSAHHDHEPACWMYSPGPDTLPPLVKLPFFSFRIQTFPQQLNHHLHSTSPPPPSTPPWLTAGAANEWGSTWQATEGGEDTSIGTAELEEEDGQDERGGVCYFRPSKELIKRRCDQHASA